jgi:hypothetical protein
MTRDLHVPQQSADVRPRHIRRSVAPVICRVALASLSNDSVGFCAMLTRKPSRLSDP